ncbi:MAG: hypothetical protein PVF91_06095 [Chromatiales bacterium]|jgi:hypothetical protein
MHDLARGLAAGLVATIVLSVLMIAKAAAGLAPGLNLIALLSGLTSGHAWPIANFWVAWATHFLVGTLLWGGLFALTADRIPLQGYWIKGVAFGVGAWVLMMVVFMPIAGGGLLGLALGPAAPVAALTLHLVFGALLGAVYGGLRGRARAPWDP